MHEYYLPEDYTAHMAWNDKEVEEVLDLINFTAEEKDEYV